MHHGSGGWVVIQRNSVGSSVHFNRKWKNYEEGFRDLEDFFWYGLKSIHCLTQTSMGNAEKF